MLHWCSHHKSYYTRNIIGELGRIHGIEASILIDPDASILLCRLFGKQFPHLDKDSLCLSDMTEPEVAIDLVLRLKRRVSVEFYIGSKTFMHPLVTHRFLDDVPTCLAMTSVDESNWKFYQLLDFTR